MDKCEVSIGGQVIVGDELWFSAKDYNAIYVLDLSTEELIWKGQVPFEPVDGINLYENILYWEGKIFLIPYFAHTLAVYDIAAGDFKKIDLPGAEAGKKCFLRTACIYCDELFVFPMYDTSIIKIDLKSFQIKLIDQWAVEIAPHLLKKTNPMYFSAHRVVIQKDKIFVPFHHAHGVLELNCKTMETHIHMLEGAKQKTDYGYGEICEDKENFWLSPAISGGMAVRWNPQNGRKDFYSCSLDEEKSLRICGIIKINDDKYYNIFDKDAKRSGDPLEGIVFCTPDKYYRICETEQYLSVCIDGAAGIRVYNKTADQKTDFFPEVEYAATSLGNAFKKHIVCESRMQNLHRLLSAIDDCDGTGDDVQKEEMSTGARIYQIISNKD